MAIPRVITGTTDVHVRMEQDGRKYENVFQFQAASAPTTAQLNQLASEIAGSVCSKMLLYLPTNCKIVEVFCKYIGVLNGATGIYTFTSGNFGTRSGNPEPASVASRITLHTGLSGKSYRGAKSLGPFVETDIDGNSFTNALITLLINFMAEMLITRVGTFFQPAVASFKLNERHRITSASLTDTNVDSQKTRLTGRGR